MMACIINGAAACGIVRNAGPGGGGWKEGVLCLCKLEGGSKSSLLALLLPFPLVGSTAAAMVVAVAAPATTMDVGVAAAAAAMVVGAVAPL